MKIIALLLLAAISCAAGAATPGTYHYTCTANGGKCPPPPIPPVPPVPPVPPAPPPVPPMPEVPAKAHAACAGKSAGTTLTYVIAKNEIMTGTCESEGGKMMFILESYSKEG